MARLLCWQERCISSYVDCNWLLILNILTNSLRKIVQVMSSINEFFNKIIEKTLLFELYFKLKLLLTVQYRWDLYEHKTSSHRNNSHPTLVIELILPIRFFIDKYSLCMFSMCCWCNNFFIHHYIPWRGLLFSKWEANLVNHVTQYT